MLKLNINYFALAILIFIIELLIGFYMHDALIRPYGGDVLVVMLIYCTVKAFLNTPVFKTAISVLIFAFAIELLQYINIVTIMGLQNNSAARTLIGTSFSVADLLCYTLGIIIVLLIENLYNHEPIFKN